MKRSGNVWFALWASRAVLLALLFAGIGHAEIFRDDFDYVGGVDVSRWDGPWGDAPEVNSEYCEFITSDSAVISADCVIPVASVTMFDFRRPAGASGNVLFHCYETYPFGGIFALDVTESLIHVYAMQGGENVTVAQIPITLDTWYHVVVQSYSDHTTTIHLYERSGDSLVDEVPIDEVTYEHDAVGSLVFRISANGNVDLDNVLIDSGSAGCADIMAKGWTDQTDLNLDCYVDLKDFALFAQMWLECIDPLNELCDHPWE